MPTATRRRTRVAPLIERVPPPAPAEPQPATTHRWSISTLGTRLVVCAKDDAGRPYLLKLTAREAVRLASHLLAGADGLFAEEELRAPCPR